MRARRVVTAIAFSIGVASLISDSCCGVTIDFPPGPIPTSLAAGDVLNISALREDANYVVAEPGSVVNFLPGGGSPVPMLIRGEINFLPGSLGIGSWIMESGVLNALDGTFGPTSIQNAQVTIAGGNFLGGFGASNSTIDFYSGGMSGGSIGLGSTMNVYSAGVLGEIRAEGELNLWGGGLAPHPNAPDGTVLLASGSVNLYVQSATIDGMPIPNLAPGSPVIIPDRGVTLQTVLADGTPFNMPLMAFNGSTYTPYTFFNSSVVSVTLLPEPATVALCGVLVPLGVRAGRMARRLRQVQEAKSIL